MDRAFASPRYHHDVRSQALVQALTDLEERLGLVDATLYYDFPVFKDDREQLVRATVLLASRSHGILLFKPSDLTDKNVRDDELRELDEELVQLHSVLFGKFLKSRLLRAGLREVKVPIKTALVATDLTRSDAVEPMGAIESEVITSLGSSLEELVTANAAAEILDEEAWSELRAVVEGSKGIIRPRERDIPEGESESSRIAILDRLEGEIATFDMHQRKAAISIVEGPQRIRGLAGSGKTIVLAMKAAHLHMNYPSANILVTFYTKSLYGFLKRSITRFYRQFDDKDPDWDKIQIKHAWGGRNLSGVYYDACIANGVQPLNFKDASGKRKKPFDYVVSELLAANHITKEYDYVLMDEAQDFPQSFFRLCFALAKGGPVDRNVVWAYDELQNIMNVRMRGPLETFGRNDAGEALVDLERATANTGSPDHDIVLYKCYRNPREVLLTAHALGFGIYSNTMVQMLEDKDHWEDVGYKVVEGNCEPGEATVIERPRENSPLSVQELAQQGDLVDTCVADEFAEEVAWIAGSIAEFVQDGLRPDDIMVVGLDDRNARVYFRNLAKLLGEKGIDVNDVLANPYSAPPFVVEDAVTLTTVYRAKGNEAAVVFAAGVEALYPTRNQQRGRNKLFTAFTRAKVWLRVSGIGRGARYFEEEIETALENSPFLRFNYPDPEAIVTLQRDLSDRAAKIQKLRAGLEQQLDFLDLDEIEREQLAETIRKKG